MYQHLIKPQESEIGKIWNKKYDNHGNEKSRTPNPYGMAEVILNHLNIITFTDTEESYFWNPEQELWINSVKHVVRELGTDYWKLHSSKHYVGEALEHVQAKTFRERDNVKHLPPELIPLQNGIYDMENNVLISHTNEYFYTTKLPVTYDPEADCPEIKNFLNSITNEPDKLQELIGYCMYRAHPIHKAFILEGGGSNGKSTFLSLLDAFLGEEHTTSVTLQDLCENAFASANLYGKLANLVYELPSTSIWHTEVFKAITGNDKITAQKKHQPHFEFRSYSKQIFACNKIPISKKDDSDAFYRRFIIIEFPYVFDEDSADKWIDTKIKQPEELDGLFNYAVEGLKRLLENGRFSETESIEDTRDKYKRKASPVYGFITDLVRTGVNCCIRKDDLFELISNYCFDNGYRIPSKSEIGKELSREMPFVRGDRRKINTRQEYVWIGITVPGYDPFEDDAGTEYVEADEPAGESLSGFGNDEVDEEYMDLSGLTGDDE